MKHISLDLIRVTEAGAIAGSKWVGSGNKLESDKAATDAMRDRLNGMDFAGKIVIGEGEKDKSYGLFAGEKIGSRWGSCDGYHGKFNDIAIDPIEGTTPTVTSGPEAMSVISVALEGAMFSPSSYYMRKLAYGPEIASKVELKLNDPLERTIELVCSATGKEPEQLLVCILDRPRHHEAIKELRELGCRIKLIQDCDVSGAVAACLPDSDIDILYGIGGSPEAILSACAIKCLGGGLQGQECTKEGESSEPILDENELVKGECAFAGTGITDGSLLRGVKWNRAKPTTNSVFMRSESKTIRWVTAEHGN